MDSQLTQIFYLIAAPGYKIPKTPQNAFNQMALHHSLPSLAALLSEAFIHHRPDPSPATTIKASSAVPHAVVNSEGIICIESKENLMGSTANETSLQFPQKKSGRHYWYRFGPLLGHSTSIEQRRTEEVINSRGSEEQIMPYTTTVCNKLKGKSLSNVQPSSTINANQSSAITQDGVLKEIGSIFIYQTQPVHLPTLSHLQLIRKS